ncbi:MAG: DUF438 domain-containing protein [Dethiobacter sp.]|nr:DUF438 domain-containing protein [Dethiobacter sp.]
MSEAINNREHRQEQLKEMIMDLHAGKQVADVKQRFKKLLDSVGPTEISEMEQRLIEEGMPADEIKKLCDVHTAVFRESLDARQPDENIPAGHPIHIFKEENKALGKVISEIESIAGKIAGTKTGTIIKDYLTQWRKIHSQLLEVEKHYSRKENILFPYLEKNGITGPPTVMWALHDEIRRDLKNISKLLADTDNLADKFLTRQIVDLVLPTLNQMKELVYKEENILFPMCLETLSPDEWQEISDQSSEIGFTLIKPGKRGSVNQAKTTTRQAPAGMLNLDAGAMTLEQLNRLLKRLPFDITFVDKDDTVQYYSAGKERIFPRTPAIIGRKVQFCHPPDSVHVVEKIVDDFKNNRRDSADFWIQMQGKFVYIRYFPIRDDYGEYQGVVEVTQDVGDIRNLEGEKRILDQVKH